MSATTLDRAHVDSDDATKSPFLLKPLLPSSPASTLSLPDPRVMSPLYSSSSDGHETAGGGGWHGKGQLQERAFPQSSSDNNLASSRDHSLSFTSERNGAKRSRGSLLVVASDAFGLRFGKRRKSMHQTASPMQPIILPGVIEISAPRPDAEEEERQQLRDAAAQAIGLTSSLLEMDPNDDDDEKETEVAVPPMSPSFQSPIRRHRPRSILTHSRTNSIAPVPIPSFPSSPAALSPFLHASATLPKYYVPSSLRIFALSKQWKSRYLIFSQPMALVTTNSSPNVSYLHLFKSSDGQERELERLEINEDSVVFVAEEQISGKKNVVKVGGTDVGARRRELNHEEGGRTMWFLQICDQAEARKWIAAIKQSIFGQRAVRAGLGSPASNFSGVEPRGDLDVMLSMRAQGIVNSPPREKHEFVGPHSPTGDQTLSSASSLHSTRSQAAISKTAPAGAVSTLKGLFTGTRPRSGSRSTSVESDRGDNEDTFGSMGANLLNMQPMMPVVSAQDLDKKIITDDQFMDAPGISHPFSASFNRARASRALSMSAVPLQPPPRSKRWTSTDTEALTNAAFLANSTHSDIGVFSHQRDGLTEPNMLPKGFRTPEHKPKTPSIQSVSTMSSVDRASTSTKRSSSVKRWSRQLPLPKRMTPPAGPPPAIPNELRPHPYAGERPCSRDSSIYSATSGKSRISTLPSFSKRTSGSSYISVNSTSTSHSAAPSQSSVASHTRHGSSHRTSMPPPPRPAPTTALPPAPTEDQSMLKAATSRSIRISLMAPRPPPTMAPPATPDDYRSRRISTGASLKSTLATIPSSPNPSMDPLRPLPSTYTTTPSSTSPPSSRANSIKQRLRILSAPSPIHVSSSSPLTPTPPLTPNSMSSHGERMIYDHSFLQLYTPITPTAPKNHLLVSSMDDEPVLRSLSPPPRRMSKPIIIPDKERITPENVPLPLSPRGSVVSLGILTMS